MPPSGNEGEKPAPPKALRHDKQARKKTLRETYKTILQPPFAPDWGSVDDQVQIDFLNELHRLFYASVETRKAREDIVRAHKGSEHRRKRGRDKAVNNQGAGDTTSVKPLQFPAVDPHSDPIHMRTHCLFGVNAVTIALEKHGKALRAADGDSVPLTSTRQVQLVVVCRWAEPKTLVAHLPSTCYAHSVPFIPLTIPDAPQLLGRAVGLQSTLAIALVATPDCQELAAFTHKHIPLAAKPHMPWLAQVESWSPGEYYDTKTGVVRTTCRYPAIVYARKKGSVKGQPVPKKPRIEQGQTAGKKKDNR